ncbi:hypothetical protein [Kitasatospora sp. NPDC093558]
MITRPADPADLPGFLALAAEVEHWFGPMTCCAVRSGAARRPSRW